MDEQSDGPVISIVIPTHQRAHVIGRALRSILAQDTAGWEALVVDDGSTDGTDDVVAAFADPRIRYLRRPLCGGVSAARNAGLDHVTSDIIGFLDSDDEYLPGALTALLDGLRAAPEASGVTGLIEGDVPARGHPMARLSRVEMLDHRTHPGLQSFAYRRARAEHLRFDESLSRSEDRHFLLELMATGPVAMTERFIARLHHTEGSLTSSPCYEPWCRFLALNHDEIAASPRLHGSWELRLVRVAIAEGHIPEARRHARAALRADRRNPQAWLVAGAAVLGVAPLRWAGALIRRMAVRRAARGNGAPARP